MTGLFRYGLASPHLCVDCEGVILIQHTLLGKRVHAVVLTRLIGMLARSAEVLEGELLERFD